VRALLSYLAVESERPHRREKLAGLLWPNYPESSARSSLRRALADLRKGIGDEGAEPPYLLITRQTIQFNREGEAWVDVTTFTSLSQTTKQTDQGAILGWVEAVDMYRGEFMEGFSLPDSPAFEDWQLLNREHHHRQV
jgi:DNA-binding SARP family transcriptional activator